MPPRQRKGSAGPAKPEQVQPNQFPPNPVPPVKQGREAPVERLYEVTGPKEVGGVKKPGKVRLTLTQGQEEALRGGGHITPAKEDAAPEDREPTKPMTGTEKDGE